MMSSAIILFREMLEITLITSIIAAATKGIPGRNWWIAIGLAGGSLIAGLFAYFANNIAQAAQGSGQELFNALAALIAVLMIGWTVTWMKKHAASQHAKIKELPRDRPSYQLAIIIAVAVIREGAEIILFSYGIIASHAANWRNLFMGGIIGGIAGVAVGTLIYVGILRFASKRIFACSNWLLMLLAASMAAQIPDYLSATGLIDNAVVLWDSSWLISESSVLGKVLHILIGYSDQPTLIELLCYIGTLLIIYVASLDLLTPSNQAAN